MLRNLQTIKNQVIQKLIHIHVNFLSRQDRINKKGESPIVLRVIYRRERRDTFTRLYCKNDLANVDLGQLAKANIRKDNGETYFIEKPRQKTGQLSIVPLVIPVIKILKKYSNSNDFRDFSWNNITNQKMNEQLKVIAQCCGLDKTLHFYLARHIFATTITLSNGVPIESVSSMLGHATIGQTQDYAKVVALRLSNDMKKVDLVYFIRFYVRLL